MLQYLLEQLRGAGTGSKTIAGLVLVAVVAIASTAAVVARRPHFELLYGELSSVESARVQRALADAGIPFEGSSPPGPFSVYVDRDDRYKALQAAASAGALERRSGGILPDDGGLSTVFMSAGEREQVTMKRQWQEMELMLQELDFVSKAVVTTTGGERRPLGASEPKTGSVMLQLRTRDALSREQADTVANLVRFGLGIEPENLNISDQSGNSLFDGSQLDETGAEAGVWLEQKRLFEQDMAERANDVLLSVLGPNKARVSVSSSWNNDLNTIVSETADPKRKVLLSETKSSSSSPAGTSPTVGGPAGVGSNTGAFGVDQAGFSETAQAPTSAPTVQVATTDSAATEYWTPRETKRTVNLTPKLERLSVSLFLDESLAGQEAKLEQNVKAAVGFDETRLDVFSTVLLPLYVPPAEDAPTEPVEESTTPSPMLRMLLERGVEIASAAAFLLLLLKTLKGAKSAPGASASAQAKDQDDVLELLAQAQIEELVKSDPARVGAILSRWASEEKVAAG